ncbi:MAG: helix-turn-helix transcriptional regulator [bacterium]|nr:helix-turn-helix transcriptional regulator [bacterium]
MKHKERAYEVGQRVKKIRRSRGYNGLHMAETLGVNRTNYYRIENGRALPRLITLINLAQSLNISLDWLILNRGEMHCEQKTAPAVADTESSPDTFDLKGMSDDVKEMLEHIREIPLLRHELLTTFYKFKEERSTLVGREMNKQ